MEEVLALNKWLSKDGKMLLIKKNYNKSRGKNTYEESQRGRIEVFKEGNIQK